MKYRAEETGLRSFSCWKQHYAASLLGIFRPFAKSSVGFRIPRSKELHSRKDKKQCKQTY